MASCSGYSRLHRVTPQDLAELTSPGNVAMSPAQVQHALGSCTNHGLKPQVAAMPLGASQACQCCDVYQPQTCASGVCNLSESNHCGNTPNPGCCAPATEVLGVSACTKFANMPCNEISASACGCIGGLSGQPLLIPNEIPIPCVSPYGDGQAFRYCAGPTKGPVIPPSNTNNNGGSQWWSGWVNGGQ